MVTQLERFQREAEDAHSLVADARCEMRVSLRHLDRRVPEKIPHNREWHAEAKRVGLQFQLPGSEEIIYAEGEVVREWVEAAPAKRERSGVRFTLLTERHRRMIDAYVDRHGSEN